MQVIIQDSPEKAVALTSKIIADQLQSKPNSVLGLATGRTMESLYDVLAAMQRKGEIDFSLTTTFNLDEYVGLAGSDKNSYRYYMNEKLFNQVNIDPRNTHLPDGLAEDLEDEADYYEYLIEDAGGIDLQLLGIGNSGHIGFNEPLSPLLSRTRAVSLTPATIAQNSPLFERPEDMPRFALTMGVGTILEAEQCLMLVTGAAKADILAKAVEGPITSMISATALQLHSDCVVIADADAAAQLTQKDYYHWNFAHAPEWASYQ